MLFRSPDLIRHLSRLMKKPARLFSLPDWMLGIAAKIARQSSSLQKLTGSLQVSSTRLSDTTGWRAPFSTEEGLMSTVAWYQNRS